MNISPVSRPAVRPPLGEVPAPTSQVQNRPFSEIMQSQKARTSFEEVMRYDIQNEMNQFEKSIRNGAPLAAQELIHYQIKAHQLGLRVELVSKLAESLMTSVKRLQNAQ